MRKSMIIILCFMLLLVGCGTKDKQIPEDISKEFYNKAIEVNNEIEKIYETKYFTFTDEKREVVNLSPIETTENNTDKEKFIAEALRDTLRYLAQYTTAYNENFKDKAREFELQFQEKHKQYKSLLGLQ